MFFLLLACLLTDNNPVAQAETVLPAGRDGVPVEPAPPPELPAALADRYQLGPRVTHAKLAAWPVYDTGRPSLPEGALSLADGLTRKLVAITEVNEGGSVPQLEVENVGEMPVLLAAGDVVTGGKQDRILTESMLLPARSGKVKVAVNCVEHGRWQEGGQGLAFGYGGKGEIDLRRTVEVEKDQSATWAKVAELNEEKRARVSEGARADLAPSTGTYMASVRNEELAAEAGRYLAALAPALDRDDRTVGHVAAIGDKLVSVELYGSPGLYDSVREPSLRSLALDAIGTDTTAPAPADPLARAFLVDAVAGQVRRSETAAAEASLKVETEGESTSAYQLRSKDGEILQLNAYAK
ncbi:MAG: hypothetical protein FJ102_04530 [Deltaproteobacteria bacterium]|nr:hypothetical protein [Deltaproteobacteria bacterium]